LDNITIRKANGHDATGIGYVHYQSWIETYTGLFPDEVIEKLSLEKSVQLATEHPENTYIAIVDEKVVGFSSYLKARDSDVENYGEIIAIYVLKAYQGKGIGRKLIKVCYHELLQYQGIIIWVLKSNVNAVRFYEAEGFEFDGKRKVLYGKEVVRMMLKF